MDLDDVEEALMRVLERYLDVHFTALAPKYKGGTLVLKPGNNTEPKEVPLSAFFKKLTSVREKLRVLEQKLNNHPKLDDADRAQLQSYLTACYGALTTFNVLFADDDDKFRGQSR